jgi:hypothetical protein
MKLLNGAISSFTKSRTTVGLREVRQLAKGGGISEGYKAHAVMNESRHARNASDLLATTMATGGNEQADVLALQLSSLPELTSGIPETLQQTENRNVSATIPFST